MKRPVGTIGWLDLTVAEATPLRDFYRDVVGWKVGEFDMGGYADYVMSTPDGDVGVAGVCHARGENAGQPTGWMVYILVADLDRSLDEVRRHGGQVLTPVRRAGEGRFAVVADPAGSNLALYQED